ncbi:MAG: hypothetical protein ACE5JU_18455 [Candidatus Binatia bacterium]
MSQIPKPIFLELAGLPVAGKTTTASLLVDELTKRGLRCIVVPEAAAISPLSHLKLNWQFNAWTLCQAVASILEHGARPSHDLVVLDRGLVDALCWVRWFRLTDGIEGATADALESFARVKTWYETCNLVVILRVKFETALKRRGQTGRIVNLQSFRELHEAYDATLKDLRTDPLVKHIAMLDTDNLSPSEVIYWTLDRLNDLWPRLGKNTGSQ